MQNAAELQPRREIISGKKLSPVDLELRALSQAMGYFIGERNVHDLV